MTFSMKISGVLENENFSRKCEIWGFLVIVSAEVPRGIVYNYPKNSGCTMDIDISTDPLLDPPAY